MDFFQRKSRFIWYALAILILTGALALAVWFSASSGAYLTAEDDWQELAGEYRIGIIDYTVDINSQTLIDQGADKTTVNTYAMLVPLQAGSHIFDSTVNETLREKEFNEGATLARVRVVNRSDSMVEVNAVADVMEQSAGAHLRVLPLPMELNSTAAGNLNYRRYVLDTLGVSQGSDAEAEAVEKLDNAYGQYWTDNPEMIFPIGILPGATTPEKASGDYITEGNRCYAYREVFMLLWSEYDTDYNLEGGDAPSRWARLQATFTVGQLD